MSDQDQLILDETRQTILLNKNLPGGMEVIRQAMNKMYRHFKSIIPESTFEDKRLLEIFKLERLMENDYLPIDTTPDFDVNNKPKLPLFINNENDCRMMLNYIVYKARVGLSKHHDVNTATLAKWCWNTSLDISEICKALGIKEKDYSCSENLGYGMFHCFNIVQFTLPNGEVKLYLVDCTYRQFFTYAESFLERIGMPLNCGPNIGTYMLMDESRKKMAEQLLKKGYIECTPENIKYYFDAFVFAGRNGLYYEGLDKSVIELADYEPHYTASEYVYALHNGGLKDEMHIGRQFEIMHEPIIFDANDDVKRTY